MITKLKSLISGLVMAWAVGANATVTVTLTATGITGSPSYSNSAFDPNWGMTTSNWQDAGSAWTYIKIWDACSASYLNTGGVASYAASASWDVAVYGEPSNATAVGISIPYALTGNRAGAAGANTNLSGTTATATSFTMTPWTSCTATGLYGASSHSVVNAAISTGSLTNGTLTKDGSGVWRGSIATVTTISGLIPTVSLSLMEPSFVTLDQQVLGFADASGWAEAKCIITLNVSNATISRTLSGSGGE